MTQPLSGAELLLSKENESLFSSLIKQATLPIAVYRGKDFIIELMNNKALELWEKKSEEVIDKPIIEALPEIKGHGFKELLTNVYQNGKPFVSPECLIPIHKNGKLRQIRCSFDFEPWHDNVNDITRIMVVFHKITEEINAHKIEESEEHLRMATETLQLGIWEYNPITNKLNCSKECKNIYQFPPGIEPDLVMIRNCIHPDDKEYVISETKRLLLGHHNNKYDLSYRILRFNNDEIRWIRLQGKVFFNENGSVKKIIGTALDITKEKEQNLQVQESEYRYRQLVHSLPAAIYTCDAEGYITLYNKAAAILWGRNPEIGKDMWCGAWKVYHPDGMPLSFEQCIMSSLLKGEKPSISTEVIIERPDGSRRNVESHPQLLYDTNGKIIGAVNMLIDITEQKESQKILKENEVRLRLATEGTKIATWDMNLENFNIIHSPHLAEILGYDKSKVFNRSQLLQQVHPDDLGIINNAFSVAMETGVYDYQVRAKKPDGTPVWIKTQGKVFFDENNVPVRMLGTMRDITESKQAEEKISNLAAIVESSADAIISEDLNGIITSWNDSAKKMFGYTAEEIIGQHISILTPADRLEEQNEILAQLQKGKGIEHFETQRITKDKKIIDISLTVSLIRNSQGDVIRTARIARDITEQKRIERLNNESEQRLNIAIEAGELGTWERNIKTDEIDYSQRFLQILGYDDNARPTYAEILNQFHPDDLLTLKKSLREVLKTQSLNLEVRITTVSNKFERWIKLKGKLFYDRKNRPEKLLGTATDITDQKTAFNLLQESEERFKFIANMAPVMIWMSGNDKFTDFFNTSWLNFTGRKIEEEKNEGWLGAVHPEDVQHCIDMYKQSFLEKKRFYVEYRLRRYDGQYRWIADNAAPRYDEKGAFIGFISACIDIDDQKRFRQKIEESELLLKTISDASPVGLWMTDVNGKTIFINQTWIEWTGLSLEEQQGPKWINCVIREDRLSTQRIFNDCFLKREKEVAEFRIIRPDGELRWCLSEGRPYYGINGEFLGYVGSVTDITEMKKLEEQKDFFISMASHELKTPITSIKGYAQIVLSRYSNSNDKFLIDSLSIIDKQIRTITNLISELLDLSKIKSNILQLNKKHFSVIEMIKEVIEEINHIHPGFNIIYSYNTEKLIYGDRERISQVLINFLTNAIKYSPNSNVINVKSTASSNNIVISVADSGIGISKSDQNKIFQRFYRVETKDERTFPGFGIGLFIASEIVERHNGKIGVVSEPGKGSVFYFSIPSENS